MRIVTDANVLFSAVLSKRLNSSSRFVFDLIKNGLVQSYTCDALMGEVYRAIQTDPKLKKIDPVYFSEFMNNISVWLNYVPMKNLEHNQAMLNRAGNDWYVIAVAKSVSADYIITYDNFLLSEKTNLKDEYDISVVTPDEFVRYYKRSGLSIPE